MSKDSTVAEPTTVSSPTGHRPEDLETTPGTASGVQITDISSPGSEPLQASTPAVEKPTPKITYESVEGELRTSTSETEKQETSDDGRTITRRVKTIRYYQPVLHRTLEDGEVVKETSEDVLVGSYVDEYCFDAPLDLVDVYSASVETQTSVDETEQTLDDGTWLRRKVTSVVAYLAVDEEETENIRDTRAEPKLAAEVNHKPPADHSDHGTMMGTELQRSAATDGRPDSEELTAGAVERASDQAVLKSVGEPVDAVSQSDSQPVQHTQLETGSISVRTTEMSADSSDLTCKVEPSVVIEAAPEYETQHAITVLHDEQITVKAMPASESSTTAEPKDVSVRSAESAEEVMPVTEELIMATPNPRQERARLTVTSVPVTSSFDEPEELIDVQHTVEQFAAPRCDLEPVNEDTITPNLRTSKGSALDSINLDSRSEKTVSVPGSGQETKKVEPREEQCVVPPATIAKETLDSATGAGDVEVTPVTKELIMAVPNPQQERARPLMTSVPITSSFDEPEEIIPDEQVIKEEHSVVQFATPVCDLKPVEEDSIAPEVPAQKDLTKNVTQTLEQTVTDKKSEALSKSEVVDCADDKMMTALESKLLTELQHVSDCGQLETAPVMEELIEAVPNQRQERSRPVMTSVPVISSFDEPEELIEECQTAEQFAAPLCDLKPVDEDVIDPSVRHPRESIKGIVKQDFTQTLGEPTTENSQQHDLAKPTPDVTATEKVTDSMMITAESKDSSEAAPVTEELITAVPNLRQERSRPIATVPITDSFDEPEDFLPGEQLIEEQQTAKQFAATPSDMKPVEESVIAAVVQPPRASSRDIVTLDSGIAVSKTDDRTSFVPVEKTKATSEAAQFQPPSTDSKAATTAEQPRTRPVLVLKSDSDTKPASPFVPSVPPMSSSRQLRRPRSANDMTPRRYGMESPQPGLYSKPRMRRESPLSFVDRLAYPASPTPLGLEDFDSPLFDDGGRQVRTRSKKLITHKVRKVRHDGEVVEDIVTEEVPDYGYSDTSSVRSGQSPAVMSPRSPSVSSLTSPLPVEPLSPGGDSLSSQSSLRVFTDTVEGEPEVVTDVQEREETLPDGRVVIRKIIRTRQKQTIVKRTVMEGPSVDDEQLTEGSGQLVIAGEDIQKPDIRTYSDEMDMRPSTETVSNDVEEVLPDGTVVRKLTTTTATHQLKTERTVVEGPYVPETVNQALQGDVLRPTQTAMLPQSATPSSAPRPASATTKTSGPSRTSARPKFRIAMESPPPPPIAGENQDATAGKTKDNSHIAGQPMSKDDQSHRPT